MDDDKKADAAARGRRNRRKGKSYERDVANALKPIYPDARRLYGQSRKGHDAPDVGGTPFWIEAGSGTTIEVHNKLQQGLRDTALCRDKNYMNAPVLACVKHVKRGLDMVTMERSQFLELLAELESLRAEKELKK